MENSSTAIIMLQRKGKTDTMRCKPSFAPVAKQSNIETFLITPIAITNMIKAGKIYALIVCL